MKANLNEEMSVVIGDFGLASKELQEDELITSQKGTALFMAPEMLFGKKYDSKVDVWGFGTLFYEMITGFIPFMGYELKQL